MAQAKGKYPRLENLMKHLDPETRTEVESLLGQASDRAQQITERGRQVMVKGLLNALKVLGVEIITKADSDSVPAAVSAAGNRKSKRRVRRKGSLRPSKKVTSKKASPDVRITAQLLLIAGAARGKNTLEKTYPKVAALLGIARKKNRLRVMGQLLARTKGKYRKGFVTRALNQTGPDKHKDLLESLARDFSAIDESQVSAESLTT